MKEKKKYWESAQYSKLIDYYDFFNENLDKDIESVKELMSNITQDIRIKTETKRKDSATNQGNLSQNSELVKDLNHILLNQHTKRIGQGLALENIQELIQSNTLSIRDTQSIMLDNGYLDQELKKLEKSRKNAIHIKDFEKAAYYRDLMPTFELLILLHTISNEYETSSFFVYREGILYFVVKSTTVFNLELGKIMENKRKD